jgi:hypothetical protein
MLPFSRCHLHPQALALCTRAPAVADELVWAAKYEVPHVWTVAENIGWPLTLVRQLQTCKAKEVIAHHAIRKALGEWHWTGERLRIARTRRGGNEGSGVRERGRALASSVYLQPLLSVRFLELELVDYPPSHDCAA